MQDLAEKSSNIKDRVLQFVEYKQISRESFFKSIGVSYGNFRGKSKESDLGSKVIAEISSQFPDVSLDWLVRGTGEMIKTDISVASSSSEVNPMPFNPSNKDQRNLSTKTIPYYGDVDVTAGPDVLFTDNGAVPTDYIHIPSFQDCDIAFPIYGDSMWPVYQPGHVVLCKEFQDWRDYVPFGEVFLIVTDNLRTVKYVKKATKDENLLLVSENKHFEPFELPKNQIRRMFFVKGAIKRNMI